MSILQALEGGAAGGWAAGGILGSDMSYAVFGIDPAPTKNAVEFDGSRWTECRPEDLRDHVRRIEGPAIIAWDAPLSFDDRASFYDRVVDRTVRDWATDMKTAGSFEEGAVNARSFAGLPHWAVTCSALGMPFGQIPPRFTLSKVPPDENSSEIAVIEVHPAVALGIWWLEQDVPAPLPRYKGKGAQKATSKIVETLGFPTEASTSDDHFDAYVAYKIGTMFRDGKAHWLGDPVVGGYVLPDSPTTDDLRERYTRIRTKPLGRRKRPQRPPA